MMTARPSSFSRSAMSSTALPLTSTRDGSLSAQRTALAISRPWSAASTSQKMPPMFQGM